MWTVVNERDEIGPDLPPDYLTSVSDGGFYGWPYSYWGQNVDERVKPPRPDLVAKAIAPDYGLGPHTASLGLTFYRASAFPPPYRGGAFIGQHGSWNRQPLNGYRVVFIPFADGRPQMPAQEFLTGFLNADNKIQGRPVGVAVDAKGALLVADDVGGVVWRVAATGLQPRPSLLRHSWERDMTAMRDTSWIRRWYPDLAYAPLSAAQVLDLYLPNDTPGPYPCIVAIHGGGFIFGDKREDQVDAPMDAVRQGYAVAAMNYRMADEALFPAAVQDVKAAIRFLRAQARSFDLIRRALLPGAIGGWLSCRHGGRHGRVSAFDDPALGNATQQSHVQAVIDWFGPVDFRSQDAELRASGKGRPVHDLPDFPSPGFWASGCRTRARLAATHQSTHISGAGPAAISDTTWLR